MAAIDSKHGNLIKKFKFNKSFNSQDTIEFIDQVIRGHRDKPYSFFWDNASIHNDSTVQRYLKRKKINVIRNI